MRQPFSGTAERIFMKLLPNDSGKMEFAASCRRLANDSKLVYAGLCLFGIVVTPDLRCDSGAITRGRHARRLRYEIMSARMDLI